MIAAVYLYQHPFTGHPLAPHPMPRWPSTARTAQTGAQQDTPQRGAFYVYALTLSQQLAQVRVVGSLVSRALKVQHIGLLHLRCCVVRSATTIAVSERGGAILLVSRHNTPGMARTHSQ